MTIRKTATGSTAAAIIAGVLLGFCRVGLASPKEVGAGVKSVVCDVGDAEEMKVVARVEDKLSDIALELCRGTQEVAVIARASIVVR